MVSMRRQEVQIMKSEDISNSSLSAAMGCLVSQTEFSKGKASEIFRRVGRQKRIVVMKNNKPSAVILSPEEYARLSEYEEDAKLLVLAEKRLAEGDGKTISFESILEKDGLTKADIDAMPDVEIE